MKNNISKSLAILILFLLSFSVIYADTHNDSLSSHPNRRATIQALAQDYTVWGINNYILNEEWAEISLETMKNNFETGWVWDEDGFEVNQIGHPIQGAMVFTAARAQGLDYLQSIKYPVLSSYIWEMTLENEPPSINDMITTTMSGAAFGEIIHRMSEITLGSAKHKSLRQQWITGIINPTGYGVNRLIYGPDIHKNYKSKTFPVLSGVSFGGIPADKFGEKNTYFPHRFIRYHTIYGNPFEKKNNFKPFDNFSFISILNIGSDDLVAEIYASGMILKLKTFSFDKSHSVLGIFQNYDFMNQDDYKVSASSIGIGYIQKKEYFKNSQLFTHLSISSILMGSAGDTNDEFDNDDFRDYHSGPGFSAKFMMKFNVKKNTEFYVRLNRYFIYAMDKSDIEGYENINLMNTGFQIKLYGPIALGGEYDLATRNFSPRGPSLNVEQKNNILRFYLVYKFIDTMKNS
ncbi:MAG: DUF3943 domain-containing protein [Candidatus Marinimicrobia bacterium]|nr:DUF3943 domain-containing protein [Candidatus Neomarinimicrobiota bacterium]